MTLTEIKKQLYIDKPVATLNRIVKGIAYYNVVLLPDSKSHLTITFAIPIIEMGDAQLFPAMESHLLIRYIQYNDKETTGTDSTIS